MSDVAIFIFGAIVTGIVALAMGLLLFAAYKDEQR